MALQLLMRCQHCGGIIRRVPGQAWLHDAGGLYEIVCGRCGCRSTSGDIPAACPACGERRDWRFSHAALPRVA